MQGVGGERLGRCLIWCHVGLIFTGLAEMGRRFDITNEQHAFDHPERYLRLLETISLSMDFSHEQC
jgi:hypothetical protein